MVSGTPAYLAPEVARGAESGLPRRCVLPRFHPLRRAGRDAPVRVRPEPDGDPAPGGIWSDRSSRRSGPLTPLLLRMLAPEPADRPVILEVAQALAGRPIEVRTMQDVPPTAVISAQTIRDSRPRRKTREPHLLADPETSEPATAGVARFDRPSPTDGRGHRRHRGPGRGRHPARLPSAPGQQHPIGRSRQHHAITQPAELSRRPGPCRQRNVPTGTVPAVDPPPAVPVTSPQDSSPAGSTPPPTGTQPPRRNPRAPEPTTSELHPPARRSRPQRRHHPSLRRPHRGRPRCRGDRVLRPDAGRHRRGLGTSDNRFQTGIAQNRQYYESFWGGVDRVVATDISGDPPDHAEATISYYFTDGRVSVERTTYRLVQDGGILKLDDSAVLSSRTG